MKQFQDVLQIDSRGPGLSDISDKIVAFLGRSGIEHGLLTLLIRHTSASLLIQENASADARADLEDYFAAIAPESPKYRHADEGSDDMPAHLRAALTQTSLSIPVADGRMMLGTWQGIFLFEHRAQPHRREIAAHIIGE